MKGYWSQTFPSGGFFCEKRWEEREKMEAMIDQRLSEVEKRAIPSVQEQQTVTALKSAREESESRGTYILTGIVRHVSCSRKSPASPLGSVRGPVATADPSDSLSEMPIALYT